MVHPFIKVVWNILFVFILADASAQTWKSLGPDSFPSLIRPNDFILRNAHGIGRVSMLRFEPAGKKCFLRKKQSSPSKLFLGSPYGGLWESGDDGRTWKSSNTDVLPNHGVSDLVIDPKKSSIRYLLTGDPDCILDPNEPALGSESCQSRGIVKSIDGGKSWNRESIGKWYDTAGVELKNYWEFPTRKIARKLIMHPRNNKVMWVVIHTYNYSTRNFDGFVFKTIDAGETWSMKLFAPDGFLKDLELDPLDNRVIYTAGRTVFRSSDAGEKWTSMQSMGLPPDSSVLRCEVALCRGSVRGMYVYVILKNSRTAELYYKADNENRFVKLAGVAESPHWRTALAIHPLKNGPVFLTHGNKVHRLIKNESGWTTQFSGGPIHDDVHDLSFSPDGRWIYASTDGGLYASADSGKTWENRSSGLNVAECWGVSIAESDSIKILAGLQDCGTLMYKDHNYSQPGWFTLRGGDGMQPWIDPSNENIFVANDGNNNLISKSSDSGRNWSSNIAPASGQRGMYVRPFVCDPNNNANWFTGYRDLFSTTDQGNNWKKIVISKDIPESDKVVAIAIAPSDSRVIYVAYSNPVWTDKVRQKLFLSRDGGESWADISTGLLGAAWTQITSLAVDPNNADRISVGFRGGWKIKMMQSESAGSAGSWRDLSEGLPNDADINCLIYDNASSPVLYAGTHTGVFKKDFRELNWNQLGHGLPKVMISGLAFQKKNSILVAGTHGRGVWICKLNEK